MEWVGFIRRSAWKNAGFGSLGLIWEHLALTEPRYDPTVLPIEHGSDAANLNLDAEENLYLNEKGDEQLGASSTYQNSIALYRFLYLSGELTPVDVVRAILPLIRRDKSPPSEHSLAWLEVHADLVLEAAMASTLRYKEKRSLGLLDGIPTAVKDEYDMEGYKTTLGSRNDYANLHVPQVSSEDDAKKDSWCVRKMQEAGAIVLGKLSLHEFGMGELVGAHLPGLYWPLDTPTNQVPIHVKTQLATTSRTGLHGTLTTRPTIPEEAHPAPPMPSPPGLSLFRWAATAAVASVSLRVSVLYTVSSLPMAGFLSFRPRTTATRPPSTAQWLPTCDLSLLCTTLSADRTPDRAFLNH